MDNLLMKNDIIIKTKINKIAGNTDVSTNKLSIRHVHPTQYGFVILPTDSNGEKCGIKKSLN